MNLQAQIATLNAARGAVPNTRGRAAETIPRAARYSTGGERPDFTAWIGNPAIRSPPDPGKKQRREREIENGPEALRRRLATGLPGPLPQQSSHATR
jgi:hypothetical protein